MTWDAGGHLDRCEAGKRHTAADAAVQEMPMLSQNGRTLYARARVPLAPSASLVSTTGSPGADRSYEALGRIA